VGFILIEGLFEGVDVGAKEGSLLIVGGDDKVGNALGTLVGEPVG